MSVVLAALLLAFTAPAGELNVARQALRDGLWEIARAHATPQTGDDAAKLIALESYAGEGDWVSVRKCLEAWKQVKGPAFDYYRAIVAGDHAQAQKLLAASGDPTAVVEAQMFEADALLKAGKREDARRLWRQAVSVTNVGERVLALAAANLMDRELLERALREVKSAKLRRLAAVHLGRLLVGDAAAAKRGEELVRSVVADSPDTEGLKEAFLAIADAAVVASNWKKAFDTYREMAEIWPEVLKLSAVQEGRGWALVGLGRREEALEAFGRAAELAGDDSVKATAIMKQGDILAELGRGDESMAKYREVLAKYPKTVVSERLRRIVAIRELEAKGRELYKAYNFEAARKQFREVAEADSARAPRMAFFEVLCLYGSGDDAAAMARARELSEQSADAGVRADATLWLAKFCYNRRDWKEARQLFAKCEGQEAQLWAARAAFAENDYQDAVFITSSLVEKYPTSRFKPEALQLQGEALMELARFDEAVLVLDLVASAAVPPSLKLRSSILKADCLYALGADNAARYNAALRSYNDIRFEGSLDPSAQIVIAFKIARTLEKLKRIPEAMDQYYSQVVLAYRTQRLQGVAMDDEARAAFSKAAFRLVDNYESLGRDQQAMNVLQLVAISDVPAAEEARRRLERISEKGRFL